MNIIYVRAAIQAATGIRLSLEQVREYLLSEGMVTKAKAKNLIFPGYSAFYDGVKAEIRPETPPPVDAIIKD